MWSHYQWSNAKSTAATSVNASSREPKAESPTNCQLWPTAVPDAISRKQTVPNTVQMIDISQWQATNKAMTLGLQKLHSRSKEREIETYHPKSHTSRVTFISISVWTYGFLHFTAFLGAPYFISHIVMTKIVAILFVHFLGKSTMHGEWIKPRLQIQASFKWKAFDVSLFFLHCRPFKWLSMMPHFEGHLHEYTTQEFATGLHNHSRCEPAKAKSATNQPIRMLFI